MSIAELRQWQPRRLLLYWMIERDRMRDNKDKELDKPWTKDPILQDYRFCNVRRMDDKVSRWLLETWYKPFKDHRNAVLMCAVARYFNEPATLSILQRLGFPDLWTPRIYKERLWELRYVGTKIFNPAYVIPAGHEMGVGKIDHVFNHVLDPIARNPPKITGETMCEALTVVKGYNGFSNFLGGQVVADLRWAMTGHWIDKGYWAPMGPGSKRGMNRIHGRHIAYPLKQPQFLRELNDLIDFCEDELPESLTGRLEAMDYQNCLCEFDKYSRALFGEGKPKQRYPGGV